MRDLPIKLCQLVRLSKHVSIPLTNKDNSLSLILVAWFVLNVLIFVCNLNKRQTYLSPWFVQNLVITDKNLITLTIEK